jgi:MFS family permease
MAQPSEAAIERPPRGTAAAVSALCLVQFIDVMCVTIVVTTLPRMLTDIKATPGNSTVVATAYAMFFGGLLMLGARLGDRYGHRRCILASLAVFAAGSVLGAVATSTLALAGARGLQGAAAAAAVPAALRLLTSVTTSSPARARAVAAWSAAGAAAGAAGFVVGGIVTSTGSWRLIFWGLLAITLGQAAAIRFLVPASPGRGREQPLNLGGAALLTLAIMLAVIGATLLGEPAHRAAGLALLVGALLAAGAFAVADHRSAAPLLPRNVLGRARVRHGTAGAFVNTATTTGAATLLTLYLQGSLGQSPLQAAATLLPLSVSVIAGSILAARLLPRWSADRLAAAGLGVIGLGIAALPLSPGTPVVVALDVAVSGFGLGLSSVATTSMATNVSEESRAIASGIANTGAQLGAAVGTAAVLLVATATTGVPGGADGRMPYLGWLAAAVVAFAAALGFVRWAIRGARNRARG